ncbi:unnamed protein product [Chrysodeixis includens]|uniref:Uncharacterized protein n=1 Tax=Chrysodeixis includens TaxID=689277 RepID=A0A9N8KVH8_CHRIL|nr:unnamed protein product [Chrysodeixis includens]
MEMEAPPYPTYLYLPDIYSPEYDSATVQALNDCASLCQIVNRYKEKFEHFVSPLLALRVVQVTLYLCTLLYAATLKFDMITVEYLAAVALDIFVYCYYGNQIILQADRVSTAAYHSAWHTMGVRSRRVLLNILLANRRPVVVRAGRFLPMDLHTFVVVGSVAEEAALAYKLHSSSWILNTTQAYWGPVIHTRICTDITIRSIPVHPSTCETTTPTGSPRAN